MSKEKVSVVIGADQLYRKIMRKKILSKQKEVEALTDREKEIRSEIKKASNDIKEAIKKRIKMDTVNTILKALKRIGFSDISFDIVDTTLTKESRVVFTRQFHNSVRTHGIYSETCSMKPTNKIIKLFIKIDELNSEYNKVWDKRRLLEHDAYALANMINKSSTKSKFVNEILKQDVFQQKTVNVDIEQLSEDMDKFIERRINS